MQRHATPASRGVSRLFFLVVVAAPLVGGSCSCAKLPGNGGPNFTLTFKSLSTKTMPADIEDDGDAKDVVVKDRVKFKPSKGSGDGLEKRLKMKSKKDGGGASLAEAVQMTGDVSAQVVVAADSLTGLVDGASLGFLERRAADDGQVARLVATWNAGIDGFTVSGSVDGKAVEMTLNLPGEHQVLLNLLDIGSEIQLQASGAGAPSTLGVAEQDGSTDTGVFAFGAEGLGVKGTLWFGNFRLTFSATTATGEVETDVAGQLAWAWYFLDDAEHIVELDPPHNMTQVYNDLSSAVTHMGLDPTGAWSLLQAGVDAGTLLPTTDGKLAVSKIKTATGWAFPASVDVYNLIQKEKTSAKPVKGHIKVAKTNIEMALALIHGFQSKSHSKLLSSVEFAVE